MNQYVVGEEVWIRAGDTAVGPRIVEKVVPNSSRVDIYGYIVEGDSYTYEKQSVYPSADAIYLAKIRSLESIIWNAKKKIAKYRAKMEKG